MMKKFIYLFIGIFALAITSCDKDQVDNVTENAAQGGLIDVPTKNLNYVVGNSGTYGFDMYVNQTPKFDVEKVLIYKSAQIQGDSATYTSNEVLVGEYPAEGTAPVKVSSPQFAYADLTSGLQVNGNDLPASDGELSIGDKFVFRLVSVMADGSQFQQAYTVDMAVSTRYAGTYVCSYLEYFRIGVQSPSYWQGDDVTIKSVDAITYEYDWGASIGWTGPLFFQVDAEGKITYPKEWNGAAIVLNDQPLTTCNEDPNDLTNVPCGAESNYVINDDVDGKDQLVMTYGYLTAGSGPREFHEILIKK